MAALNRGLTMPPPQAWDSTFPHIQHYNNDKGKEQYGIGGHNYCRC